MITMEFYPINMRAVVQMEAWEQAVARLMAMRRMELLDDRDRAAIDAAIRALDHRHRSRARSAVRAAMRKGETAETAKTTETAEAAETIETAEAAETIETAEAAETIDNATEACQ